MSYRIREYRPGFVEVSDEPREETVERKEDALQIPWLKSKGMLEINGRFVMHHEFIVATIQEE